jgi:hypothetical protein
MVTLEWDLDRTDGVTFVRAYVTAGRACRVRVENRLDGPVWPPRRRGQPAAGWDGDGFEGVAAPNARLVGGYATPAPPEEPPVELAVAEHVDEAPEQSVAVPNAPDVTVPTVESTPAGVVRTLGNPLVPRDAVPVPEQGDRDDGDAGDRTTTRRPRSR